MLSISGFGFLAAGLASSFFAGGGATFGAGFFTRSGSHSSVARAGVQSFVRTQTHAPAARTTLPWESTRYPWFFASCAETDAGKNTPAAARPTSVIRIAEIMIIDPPVYCKELGTRRNAGQPGVSPSLLISQPIGHSKLCGNHNTVLR